MPIAGCALADRLRRAQPLIGMRRRHPDVDDRHVRLRAVDELEQLLGVGGHPDDLEPGLLEQPRQPLAEDHRVVGDRYAHGICAIRRVPRPGGLDTVNWPPSASTRSARPRSPDPGRHGRPADPVVRDLDGQRAPVVGDADPDLAPVRVLDRVAQRLAREVVGGGLDLVG